MKKTLVLAILALLTACETAPSAYVAEPLAFETSNAAPIRFNVAKIDVLNHYQSPLRLPNVEQDFPVAPAKAVEQWAHKRLRATGSSGRLEVTIHDGSVIETPLKKKGGVEGLFTDDQDSRYDAKIAVTFRIYNDSSLASKATGEVILTRYATINEKSTIFDRERLYHRMTQQMMLDFERESNDRFHQYFAAYLK